MPQNANRPVLAHRAAGTGMLRNYMDPRNGWQDIPSPTAPARPRPFNRMPLDDRLDWLHALDGSGRLNAIEAAICRDALGRLQIMPGIRLPGRRVRIIDHLIRRHRSEERRR